MDLFEHIKIATHAPSRDPTAFGPAHALHLKLLGHANAFKEGDATLGVAADSEGAREFARLLLANTKVADICKYPVFKDHIFELSCEVADPAVLAALAPLTLGQLKHKLLSLPAETIQEEILPGLTSDVIGYLIKILSNEDLVTVGAKIFNPIAPDSNLGAKGYMGARVQPNSPTDDPEEIQFQCFDAFSYAVGDVMLGTNPVSSDPQSVLRVELCLKEVIDVFGLQDILPHCVLAHVDIQAEIETANPGSTALWFQSIAGSDAANQTFDLPVDRMLAHAVSRADTKYGLYLETGQGADFTNGHAKGVDMIMHEARKYGFARALKHKMQEHAKKHGKAPPRLQQNNVAGFIGPEVFRSREQLVRVCLEDICIGKLHGLAAGLDVCTTMHMDISLDDLDWCLDHIMPACPSWCMALPTKNDPMLSYLTTAFQDHVRIRNKFGYKVDDRMWKFFVEELKVVRQDGTPTEKFGDPAWVYLQFRRRKNDARSEEVILQEAQAKIEALSKRGVPLAVGHGKSPWDLNPALDQRIRELYKDAKATLWNEFSAEFLATIPNTIFLETTSANRADYVYKPQTGEVLSKRSLQVLHSQTMKEPQCNCYVVISDGLCCDAISDHGHLGPFLARVRELFKSSPFKPSPRNLVIKHGRVRAGYQVGEALYGGRESLRFGAILHVIGERPGSGHHTFSCYLTVSSVGQDGWGRPRAVDHDITRVVSGISDTSLNPRLAAEECVEILSGLVDKMGVGEGRAELLVEEDTSLKRLKTVETIEQVELELELEA